MSSTHESRRYDAPELVQKESMTPRAASSSGRSRSARNQGAGVPADSGITVQFLFSAIRRWWMVAVPAAFLLAAGAVAAVYLLFEPVYEAAAWFKIEERPPYLAFESKDESRARTFFQTQIETIRGPFVLGPVVKRPEIAQMREIAEQSDKVAWLGKQIKVASVGLSEYFKILYSSHDPKDAAAVVNAVTEAYSGLRDQSNAERNQRVIDMLGGEKQKHSAEVVRLRDDVRTLAAAITGKDPLAAKSESEGSQKSSLADVESKLVAAQVERVVLEARLKVVEEEIAAAKNDAPATEPDEKLSPQEIKLRDVMVEKAVEGDAEVERLKATIAAGRAALDDYEKRLLTKGKEDPYYKRSADRILGYEHQLEELRAELRSRSTREIEVLLVAKRTQPAATHSLRRVDQLAKLRQDLAACRLVEQMLQDRYKQQRKSLEQTAGEAMELVFKRDELARAEKVYELIAQRATELQTERGAPSRVILMAAAEPPGAPVEVLPYRKMAMAGLLAFCLPFALVIGWERLAGRVGDSQSLAQESTISVLGEITQLPTRKLVRRQSTTIQTSYDTRLFEESVDSLRTSLLLSRQLNGMRVLTVTSAAKHEGKTSVAAQLALSFARSTGDMLLLIDGDMRSPDLHRVFDVPLEPGLAQVLAGECRLEDAITQTWDNRLNLLPAGRLKASPHTLLGNGAWKSLLAGIPQSYRYIVIDTPPVLAASEALVLANAADASLVCAMRDISRVQQVRATVDRLAAAGCRPVGMVLNGVPARQYTSRYGEYVSQ